MDWNETLNEELKSEPAKLTERQQQRAQKGWAHNNNFPALSAVIRHWTWKVYSPSWAWAKDERLGRYAHPNGSSRWHLPWQTQCVILCGTVMRKTTVATTVRPQTINRPICKSHLLNSESQIKDPLRHQDGRFESLVFKAPKTFFLCTFWHHTTQRHQVVWFHVAFYWFFCLCFYYQD